MPFPTREAVYTALFSQLQTPQTKVLFTTFIRKAILPSDITTQNSPLLSLLEGNTRTTYDANRLEKKEWEAWIVVYFVAPHLTSPGAGDLTASGAKVLNPLLDAVHDALAPNNQQTNTLDLFDSNGNKVASWVRVEGVTVIETGDTDPAGVGGALIPLRMLIP